MTVVEDGERMFSRFILPKAINYGVWGNPVGIGWILSKIFVYTAPTNKEPLTRTITESSLTSQSFSYVSNRFTKALGIIQFSDTITIGNGNTLRAVAMELNQYEHEQTGSPNTANNYVKVIWERIEDYAKVDSSDDFTLMVNIRVLRK